MESQAESNSCHCVGTREGVTQTGKWVTGGRSPVGRAAGKSVLFLHLETCGNLSPSCSCFSVHCCGGPSSPGERPQLLGDKRSLTWGVRPCMLAVDSRPGRLLRHGLAPFLASGLALLAPFWRLPAPIPALAQQGPLSSLEAHPSLCPLSASWSIAPASCTWAVC